MSAPITYSEFFIAAPNDLLDKLWTGLPWEKREDAPRREFWCNDFGMAYTYGHGAGERTYLPQDEPASILLVREQLRAVTGFWFEGCFANGYPDEKHALGWHADDDANIDHSKPIAVVSLGAPRAILFRKNGAKGMDREEQVLASGSLLLMHPGMQFTHEHRIPKHSAPCGPRISLTFRGLRRPEMMQT